MRASFFPLLILVPLVRCNSCASQLVSLPIGNVTVLDPNVRRGLALSVGTPPQALAFGIAGYLNNSFLFADHDACGIHEQDSDACIVGRGGIFFANESSTWENTTGNTNALSAVDTPAATFNFTEGATGEDVLTMNATFELQRFPIAITTQGLTLNSIGLGPNSTLLNALVSSGAALSKTWSIAWGLTGANPQDQMDGSIVFGGYDQAKVDGQNVTIPIDRTTSCRTGLVATINSIDVGFSNGTSQNVFASPIRMCLDPSFAIVSFPDSILNKFQSKAGGFYEGLSTGTAVNGLLYDVDNVFSGNLSVTLSPDVVITIPNHQLVVPNHIVSGNATIFSDETREIVVGSPQGVDPTDITYLGQPFFTSAYMMVNEETFTVWKSKATQTQNLVAVDASGVVCKSATTAISSPSYSTYGSPDHSDGSHGLSAGGIAGISIGVGIAVISAVAASFFSWRQKAQRRQLLSHDTHELVPTAYGYSSQKYMMDGDHGDHNDIHRQNSPFELPSTELDRWNLLRQQGKISELG